MAKTPEPGDVYLLDGHAVIVIAHSDNRWDSSKHIPKDAQVFWLTNGASGEFFYNGSTYNTLSDRPGRLQYLCSIKSLPKFILDHKEELMASYGT